MQMQHRPSLTDYVRSEFRGKKMIELIAGWRQPVGLQRCCLCSLGRRRPRALTAGGGAVMENSDWPENTAADLFIQQPLNQSQHSAIVDMNECLLQVRQRQR